MRQQQLEGLVIATIDRARAGYPVEDDRIEFKQAWPDPAKPRQLGGVANRANGNFVIYIVGADESGALFDLDNVDVADWWARLSSKFDGVAPDLINHIIVPIDESKSVTALQFGTDRAPYVVNADKGGSPEREVPIRDGTRTRSATRTELLRMLLPQASVPPALVLSGGLNAYWNAGEEGSEGHCSISGSATIFLEHHASAGIMLPFHEMTATADAEDLVFPLSTYLRQPNEAEGSPAFGVQVRRDGVFSTGPGSFRLSFTAKFPTSKKGFLQGVPDWRINFRLGVVGSPRAIQVDVSLSPKEFAPFSGVIQVELGRWAFQAHASAADGITRQVLSQV